MTDEDTKPKDPVINSAPIKEIKKDIELGGPKGPEPTRYGDWEVKGRVSDF